MLGPKIGVLCPHFWQENNKISGKQQNLIFIIESNGLTLFKYLQKNHELNFGHYVLRAWKDLSVSNEAINW